MGRYWLVPPVARLTADMSTVSAEAVIPIIHSGVFQVGDDVMMGKECLTIGDITEGAETITLGVSRGQRGTTVKRHVAGARLSGIRHAIVATSPGGGTTWDYTVRWGALLNGSLTTTSPGGDGELSFTVVDYDTDGGLTALPDRNSDIYVADADGFAGRYWNGIVESPEIIKRGRRGAYEVTITAHGVATMATDRIYETSTIYAKDNPIHVGVKHARDTLCSEFIDITDNTRITAGLNNLLVNSQNMIGKNFMEVANQQVSLGDGTEGDQILWHVLQRESDGQYVLEVKLRPAAPSYVVAKDQLEPGWKLRWARSDIRNRVVVQYAGGIAAAQDAASIAALGATRTMFVDAANQIDSHGTALYAAKAILARYKDGLAAGDDFMVRWPNVINDAFAAPIDLWRMRSGRAITLSDIDPGNATLPAGDEFVRTTKWDLVKHTMSWQTERLRTPANVIGQLIKRDSARLDSSMHQPPANSGAVVPHANAAYPGVEAKTPRLGTDGRVGYKQLAKGLDRLPAIGLIGSKASDAPQVAEAEEATMPVTWPSKLLRVYVQRTDFANTAAGTVSVMVGKRAPGEWPSSTDIIQVDIAGDYGDPDGYPPPDDTKLEPGDELVFTVLGSPAPVATTYLRMWGDIKRSGDELEIPSDPGAPGLSTTSVGGSGVNPIINVETNKDARVQIEYGTTTDYGSWSLISEVLGTEHEIPLTGLAPGQTYHYRAHMESVQLEAGTSADFSFST